MEHFQHRSFTHFYVDLKQNDPLDVLYKKIFMPHYAALVLTLVSILIIIYAHIQRISYIANNQIYLIYQYG